MFRPCFDKVEYTLLLSFLSKITKIVTQDERWQNYSTCKTNQDDKLRARWQTKMTNLEQDDKPRWQIESKHHLQLKKYRVELFKTMT